MTTSAKRRFFGADIRRLSYEELPLVNDWCCVIIPSHRPDGLAIVKFPRCPPPARLLPYLLSWEAAIPVLRGLGLTLGLQSDEDGRVFGHTVYISDEARRHARHLRRFLSEDAWRRGLIQ